MDTNNDSLRNRTKVSLEETIEIATIGAIFYKQGNLDKAKTVFEGLIELDSEIFEIQSCLGAFYTRVREDEKALLHLNKAILLNPENIAPYVNRAEVNIRNFNIEQVVTDILTVIKLDPKLISPDANRARTMLLGIYDALKTKGWIK